MAVIQPQVAPMCHLALMRPLDPRAADFTAHHLLDVCVGGLISLLTLAFTIMLVFFIVEFLNIDDIIYACQSEQTCQEVSLIRTDWLHHSISSPFAVVYYYLLFTLYWLWMLLHFVWELRPLFETRTLYRDKLHLEDADLQVVAWDEVVVKLVELQKSRAVTQVEGCREQTVDWTN